MDKAKNFYWPWSKPALPLNHVDVAAQDLDQARLELLQHEKERESAECACTILKKRITRLENYNQGVVNEQ